MSKKIWNLMYVAGNPRIFDRVISNADNPCSREEALAGAKTVAGNGGNWRTWVEHKDTGERIYENDIEIAFRKAKEDAAKPEAIACNTCEGIGNLPRNAGDPWVLGCEVCRGTGKVLPMIESAEAI